jgi:uncharacterized membrane-anchored protein YitT (DUF2179 family)
MNLFKMSHLFKRHWVVLAAFALSFLLTIFISPENAVVAQTGVTTVSDTNSEVAKAERSNSSLTEFSEQIGIAEGIPAIAAPTLDFGF